MIGLGVGAGRIQEPAIITITNYQINDGNSLFLAHLAGDDVALKLLTRKLELI